MSAWFLTFKDAFNISLAAQNPKDVDGVFLKKIINPNGFKSRNRPRAQILKLRIARRIARAYEGMEAQRLNGAPDGIPGANGDLRMIYDKEIIAKLPTTARHHPWQIADTVESVGSLSVGLPGKALRIPGGHLSLFHQGDLA
jgi:hypothetical protein